MKTLAILATLATIIALPLSPVVIAAGSPIPKPPPPRPTPPPYVAPHKAHHHERHDAAPVAPVAQAGDAGVWVLMVAVVDE